MIKKSREMTQKNVLVTFKAPEQFLGMIVDKANTISTCVGFEPYKNKNEESTHILFWEVVSKNSGRKIKKTTSAKLRLSDLPATEKSFL